MHVLLAQREADTAAAQWFTYVSLIMLIGAVAVLLIVAVGMVRRWKRRQLDAIEKDRASRRAGQAGERIDAWRASSERYVDRDKLSQDDLFKREEEADFDRDDDDFDPAFGGYDQPGATEEDDERDPFGLFADKPYQDADDEDEDEDDDEGFDEDEDDWDKEDEKR